MDTADLEVMSCPPFDPAADVRITHTVQQSRATGGDGENHSRGVILNHYLRGPSVGKGQHGTVYKCWDLAQSSVEVAIKVVSRHNPRADRLNQLKRKRIPRSGPHLPVTDNLGSQEYKIRKEIAVMKLCRHPHVVRLLEVIDDKLYQKVYMVMEFLGGGEIKWRDSKSSPVLRVDQSRRICRDVILGLEYLHFQGIIHRDIKPANLMWTSDRRTVKITDFGVAHMSAAQRLAGSGRHRPGSVGAAGTTDSDADIQLLFDDSELCKTAGTPSFLAPEVVFDFGTEILPPSSSGALAASDSNSVTTLQAPAPHRPPITKAIDVWALGVTLYCLLFGKTPFRVESNHEFALYGVICTQDWDVEPCMGLDRIPTEGRHHDCPNDKPCSEGAEIVKLLERLLEKDMSKRITLDEVKRHRWFLRDIPDRERWVRETLPNSKVVIAITEDAISDAVSPMRFRWRQRLTNRLTSFLRTVRPQRSFRSADGHSDSDDVGVRSLPSIDMSRYNTEKGSSRRPARASNSRIAQSSGKTRERTLHTRGEAHTPIASSSRRTRPVANISSSPRSKSSDTRTPGSSGGTQSNKNLQRRRGSASVLTGPERSAPSVHSLSPTTTTPDEPRPRSRFSLSSLRWRRGDTQPSTPASASATSVPVTPPMSMSSSREQSRSALPPPLPGGVPTSSPPVVSPVLAAAGDGDEDALPAMRASSWGDVGEYRRLVRAPHEVASMHSGAGDHDEPLDLDVVVVGAGGFANGPLSPTPSNSAGALALVASGSGSGCAQPYGNNYARDVLCRRLPSSSSAAAGPPLTSGSASASRGSHGSGFGVVMVGGGGSSSSSRWHPHPYPHPHSHSHSLHTNANAPHSIMQLSPSFSSGECQSGQGDGDGDGDGEVEGDASDGDSDSFFARNSEEIVRPRVVIPNSIHNVFRPNDRGHEQQGCLQDEDGGDVDNDWGAYGARPSHRMDSHSRRGKDVYGEDEDEEEEDDDDDGSAGSGGERPIEVRRRRQLAWADHDLEDDDDEDEEDEDEEDDGPPPTPP